METEISYDVKADIAKAKQFTDEITNDPMVTTHADKIRSTADVLSTSLQNMQQAKYPGLSAEATDVKSAASAINPETLMLNQRDAVKSFFRKAADLLTKMN
jgi:DNA-binding MltR family transcriptional regulator